MKNLFLDSNIWLSLYHFSNDDLEQFRKLKSRVGSEIRLFIPTQVFSEVYRNRDAKLKDALSKFDKFNFTFPAFSKGYDEYASFSAKVSELRKEHAEWLRKIHADIASQNLAADKVLSEFFIPSELIECSPEIVRTAELRYKMGNPPGKDNKFGDAINWECLLSCVPEGEDLFFVSADNDYTSVIDSTAFNLYLREEWKKRKGGQIIYFKSLVAFLDAHVKDITLQTERKKNDLIEELGGSFCFAETHQLITELSKFHEWSQDQIDRLCYIAVNNNQVSWIITDSDVSAFYSELIKGTSKSSESVIGVLELLEEDENNGEEGF